ncbi:uncharacterized protein LOC127719182 [Mytilus californianus]|uniref:uncharacterized protein LOC127719182 n=1 Tax=Mytilus californianus TaxID=6549 RepID=UPI0022476C63|nr:uncharacterized protein LOC127719182 [Mytilus californianus]
MRHLIRKLKLTEEKEKRILRQLENWETHGKHFLSGTTLGLEIAEEIRQHTHVLSKYVLAPMDETDDQFIRVHKELNDLETGLQKYLERIQKLESMATKHELRLKCVEAEMEKKDEDAIPNNIRVC